MRKLKQLIQPSCWCSTCTPNWRCCTSKSCSEASSSDHSAISGLLRSSSVGTAGMARRKRRSPMMGIYRRRTRSGESAAGTAPYLAPWTSCRISLSMRWKRELDSSRTSGHTMAGLLKNCTEIWEAKTSASSWSEAR